MVLRRLTLILSLVLLLMIVPIASAQGDQRCFSETGQCISGRIREFWEQNGGLPVFGLPLGPQHEEVIDGKPFQVQLFERNRLELHPENHRPYDVLLGRMGVDRLAQQGRDWFTFPKSSQRPGCRFFAETGHNVCGLVLRAWLASGLELDGRKGKTEAENLALFGLPLSDEQMEILSDGRAYMVQWFERARFEVHAELPRVPVLLGLLGAEVRDGQTASPPPAQIVPVSPPVITPEPTPTPEQPVADPPPPSGTRIGAICRDGTRSSATGRGACSHHGGVDHWLYA